jgi:hypothetical protein
MLEHDAGLRDRRCAAPESGRRFEYAYTKSAFIRTRSAVKTSPVVKVTPVARPDWSSTLTFETDVESL